MAVTDNSARLTTNMTLQRLTFARWHVNNVTDKQVS